MPLGITKGIGNWRSQHHSVERFTDNAAYTSAHPDDTLVLAGPPRSMDKSTSDFGGNPSTAWKSLMAIGMLQGFQIGSQKPTQPVQAIGSGRLFFVSGKAQTSWSLGRLFCNGRNLVRALYHNAVAGGVPVQNFDDRPVATSASDTFYLNLDSELFYVPFGLAAIFRDKAKNLLGAVYIELCMIQSYNVGFNAGQNMIMESVNGMCDRVLPFHPTEVNTPGVPRATIDAVIGFTAGTMAPTNGTGLLDNDLANTNSEI